MANLELEPEIMSQAVEGGLWLLNSFKYEWGPKQLADDCYHKFCVEYGYRPPSSLYEASLSLLSWHNETMNIWSHLLGFACVVVAIVMFVYDTWSFLRCAEEDEQAMERKNYLHFSSPSFISSSSLEKLVLGAFLVCAGICLLLSTVYHWFCCLSPDYSHGLLKLDLTGVALLIGSSYFPAVYFGFYCHTELQVTYLAVSVLVLVMGLLAPWFTFSVGGHPINTYIFVSLVVVGLLPCLHWVLITPPFYRDQLYTGRHVIELLCYVIVSSPDLL
jgi:adiponectin receptor